MRTLVVYFTEHALRIIKPCEHPPHAGLQLTIWPIAIALIIKSVNHFFQSPLISGWWHTKARSSCTRGNQLP